MSSPRRIGLVVNPTSGRGRGGGLGAHTGGLLRAAGHDVLTLSGDSASQALARCIDAVADGIDTLVVVGGDGMVHLGANAVCGTDTALGIVAAGTANDNALSLGLPVLDAAAAAAVVDAGHRRRIDAVRRVVPGAVPGARDQWYVGVLCGGFDAVVNERANTWRWPRGRMRYHLAAARELPVFRPLPYQLELDGVPWQTEAVLVAVGNGPAYGGGMLIAPDARYDDGLLDVLVVGPLSVPRLLAVFPKVFSGKHIGHPAVTVRRARRVRLSTPGIVTYADGERFGALPLEVEVVPGALQVLTPSAVPARPDRDA